MNTSVYRKQEFSYDTANALRFIYTMSKTVSKDGGLAPSQPSPAAGEQWLPVLDMAIAEVGSVVQWLRPIALDVIVACDVAEIRHPVFLLFLNLFSFFILVAFFGVTPHVLLHLWENGNKKQYKHRAS